MWDSTNALISSTEDASPSLRMMQAPDTGEECPRGVSGEFVARGYNIMKGYYKMPHQLRRAVGPGHDPRPDVGKIGRRKIRMVHHRDEHGGHPVEGGDPLLVDAGQGGLEEY